MENSMAHRTTTERASDRELVVTRSFDATPRIVFRAWSQADLMLRWWAPKSFGITFISCEMDVRTGGTYRFVFGHPASEQPMAFFGRYLEVVPDARIVWTNEESGPDGSVTTLTFEARGGGTLLVLRDLYPSKEALDAAIASDSTGAFAEQFEALDEILPTLAI
jgi:uncharacterized protein YndB with AHSA1/START domain